MRMAHAAIAPGYTVDDLDWLRDELGVAHLELDPWGSLIVTPATDEHEMALAILHEQAIRQLSLSLGSVRANGFPWKIPGGSGYMNVPDLVVLAPGWHRVGELHLEPPPLLIVEVGSPSTRAVDRGRKLSDYRLGQANRYLLVDLPEGDFSNEAGFELHDFADDRVTTAGAAIDVPVAGTVVHFDLAAPAAK
jgi:Uma2 family endonuclease